MCMRAVGSPKQVPDPVQPWLQHPWRPPCPSGIPQEPVRDDVPRAVRGLVLGTRRDQQGGRPRPPQTAQGCNDRRHHDGDWLAAALGPRLLCGCGAQEARLNADIGEGRRRTRLSCDCRTAVQIEAEDLRTTGRLAMAGVDTRSTSSIAFGRSTSRNRLYPSEPPRISRDLLVLALGYRLQEIEHGGLGKSTRRKLQTMAKALRTMGRVGPRAVQRSIVSPFSNGV